MIDKEKKIANVKNANRTMKKNMVFILGPTLAYKKGLRK